MPRYCRPLTGLFLVLFGFALAPAAAVPAAPPLILISIDGYRADYIERGHSPALAGLAAEGVHAKGLRPVWPTLTYPNHYTIVTGLYPDRHGMVNNNMRDPVLGEFSPGNIPANADGRWWSQAEPIWVTAIRKGLHTASFFWPGTQAEIRGVRPTYWQTYDPRIPADARVDQVLAWLDEPAAQRPSFITLYFEHVDSAGHSYGPDSPQLDAALSSVDHALQRLIDGLRARKQFDTTNLVIVSDHGMRATSPERTVLLDTFANPEHFELSSSLVLAGIDPRPEYAEEVEKALLAPHDHLECWKKEHTPAKYHYGHNPRIPAILCLAAEGWLVGTAASEARHSHPVLGAHGYDNDDPQMRALFVAHGPSLRQHLQVPEFDNIHLYILLARLLRLQPLPNDGDPSVTAGMLSSAR